MSDEERLRGCRFALRIFLTFLLLALIACYFAWRHLKQQQDARKAREHEKQLQHRTKWPGPEE